MPVFGLRKRSAASSTEVLTYNADCTVSFMPHTRDIAVGDDCPYGRDVRVTGLPIIGRSSQINGGVWINHGEYLTIDDTAPGTSPEFDEVYEAAEEGVVKAIKATGTLCVTEALSIIGEQVTLAIPWNEHKAERTNYYHRGRTLELPYFMRGSEPGGVCRHQAALNGYVCERLALNGILDMTVHLNRNRHRGGGHAWVRLTSQVTGTEYISDVTHGVYAAVTEIGGAAWNYTLSGEDQTGIVDAV